MPVWAFVVIINTGSMPETGGNNVLLIEMGCVEQLVYYMDFVLNLNYCKI